MTFEKRVTVSVLNQLYKTPFGFSCDSVKNCAKTHREFQVAVRWPNDGIDVDYIPRIVTAIIVGVKLVHPECAQKMVKIETARNYEDDNLYFIVDFERQDSTT